MNEKETGRPERRSIEGRKREELVKKSLEISAPSYHSHLGIQLTLTQPNLSPIHPYTLQPRNTSDRNQNPSITSSLLLRNSKPSTIPPQPNATYPRAPPSLHPPVTKSKLPPPKKLPYNAALCPQHIISTSMTTHRERTRLTYRTVHRSAAHAARSALRAVV